MEVILYTTITTITTTTTTTTTNTPVQQPLFQDNLGKPVPKK